MHQGPQTLESIAHDEGRFLAVQGASGTEFIDTWHVRDWYSTIEEVEDENGKKSQETRYYWTEAKSQKEIDGLGIKGTYLGEAVVIFKGYYDENLGKDETLTGEGQRQPV